LKEQTRAPHALSGQKLFSYYPSIPSPPQDLPSTLHMHHTPPSSPQPQPQAQPQADDFPLGLLQTALDTCAALTSRIEQLESDKLSQALEITRLKKRVKRLEKGQKVKVFKLRRLKKVGTSQRVETSDDTIMEDVSNQERMIVELDKDEGIELMGEKEKTEQSKDISHDDKVEGRKTEKQAEIYQIDMDHAAKVLKVVTAASAPVSAASKIIPAAEPNIPAVTITAVPVKVAAASTRRRRGVVIRDPKEESTAITPAETKSKDMGKGIMVEEPKPMKKKQQVEMDEGYARKLHEEFNQDTDWDVAIEHFKQKAKEDPFMQRYQNTAGFRLDFFKGMSYDDIRPIFEAKFNKNMNSESSQKEEAKEVEDLKQHLEIVPDEDDDVYTEATPLARKDNVWKTRWTRQSLELMLPWSLKKNTKCFNAAGEELSAVKHKLILMDTATEERVNTAK
nr:hypothetical protein [Tanacetum cinerariifolium]